MSRAPILVATILASALSAVAVAGPPAPTVPLGKWMVVRESNGKGLKAGSGVRFRADGYDTAANGKGFAAKGTCTATGPELKCEGGLTATAVAADSVKAQQGAVAMTLAPASDAESASFDKWLADTVAQQAACSAAAKCCVASEGPLGHPCDLKAVLGDRSTATCKAALEKVRAELNAKKAALPADCR